MHDQTRYLLLGLGIGVVLGNLPPWLTATNPDMSEVKGSVASIIGAGIAAGLVKAFSKDKKDRTP